MTDDQKRWSQKGELVPQCTAGAEKQDKQYKPAPPRFERG